MATQDDDDCSAELAVFQAYIDLINSERETNWARNNALLVANSLILGAIIASPNGLTGDRGLTVALLAAGFLITVGLGRNHHCRMERARSPRQAGGDAVVALLRKVAQSIFKRRKPSSNARRNLHPDFADDLRVRIDLSVAWLFAIFGLARCQDGVLRAAPQQMIERDRAWSPGEAAARATRATRL